MVTPVRTIKIIFHRFNRRLSNTFIRIYINWIVLFIDNNEITDTRVKFYCLFHEVNLEIFSLINTPLLENVNAPGAFIRRNTVFISWRILPFSVTFLITHNAPFYSPTPVVTSSLLINNT